VVENYFPVLGYYDPWDSKAIGQKRKLKGSTLKKKFSNNLPERGLF
jgi:hypothetical protein